MRLLLSSAVATCLAISGLVTPPATAVDSARYVGAGVAVVRAGGETTVDNGIVVCDSGDGVGTGGVCLPFGGGDAVHVVDDVLGGEVAFQVCIDNNGDNFCSFPDPDPDCPDEVVFSHDDQGRFFNPVGPLSTGFLPDCPGGAWRGYVVLTCEGVHESGTAHAHPVTTGTATVTGDGQGYGTFCGKPLVDRKAYVVNGGGNLTCGMALARDPQVEGSYTGAVAGGPWRVVGGTEVAVECTVQHSADPSSSEAAVVSGAPATGVATAFGSVTISADPEQRVYLCTAVTWQDADGPRRHEHDADPATPGTQCALATAASSGEFASLTVLQSAG